MTMNTMTYAISIMLNFILAIAIAPFMKQLILNWKRMFLLKKGYGYIKIVGNDARIHTFFTKLNGTTLEKLRKKHGFKVIEPTARVSEENIPTYYFREGFVEPINFFKPYKVNVTIPNLDDPEKEIVYTVEATPFSQGFESKKIDNLILGEVQAVDIANEFKKNDLIYKVLLATAVLSGIAALYSFDVANKMNVLQQAGVLFG